MTKNVSLNGPRVPAAATPTAQAAAPAAAPPASADAKPGEGKVPDDQVTVGWAETNAPLKPGEKYAGTSLTGSMAQLAASLSNLGDVTMLPAHLQRELANLRAMVLGQGGGLTDAKATKLMELLAPYAERLATLAKPQTAQWGQPQAPQLLRAGVAEQLLKPMLNAGLAHVVEVTTHRTGVQVAKEMLAAKEPEDVRDTLKGLRFESTEAGRHAAEHGVNTTSATSAPVISAEQRQARLRDDEEEANEGLRKKRGGSRWGVLHGERSELGKLDENQKWLPDEKALFSAGVVALVIALSVVALLTLFR